MSVIWIREETIELLSLFVIPLHYLIIVAVRPAREDQLVRKTVVRDHLATSLTEILQRLVTTDHFFELVDRGRHIGEERGLCDCVPVERGILVDPILEVICCYRERRGPGSVGPGKTGQWCPALEAEPRLIAVGVLRAIPNLVHRCGLPGRETIRVIGTAPLPATNELLCAVIALARLLDN